jgi:hypothetical protein
LRGTLTLRGAAPGLRKLSLSWRENAIKWPGPLLAVRTIQAAAKPPFSVGFPPARPDHRLRPNLLDIQLDETNRCPVRLQIYWSTARARQIDMEVLATTVHEFGKLEVVTWSSLPAKETTARSECLVRVSAERGRWIDVCEAPRVGADWMVVPRDRDAAALTLDGRSPSLDESILTPPFHSPIVCYRPAGQSWSYVEMTHPDDCVRIIAQCERGKVSWGFGLFGLDIEKGVILRGRVRGAFIPRRRDTDQATRLFRQFVAEPPHLSV